ncbi:uncharacterized protein JCM6883_006440 [Sporobolomyces salmoneus]|uniref:uncharacterized protein n=1 Tax=Sporobolomyces salmoneus TaxID=183962 RepID=UPI00317FC6F7
MSSQPSNPGASGECVLCGKKGYTRCSACSSHGLDWMFFCSKEHQKFIWPIHKRFCGVNASPLMWPLLADAEADEAKEVLKDLRREQSKTSAKSKDLKGLGVVKLPGSSTEMDIEMYFCSTEHQKLVWPLHRRFCGVNSSPVYWPLLSDSEADKAREVLKDLRREQSASRSSARPEAVKLQRLGFADIEMMVGSGGFERLRLEKVLPQILENSDPSWSMSRQSRSLFVATFRQQLSIIKLELADRRTSRSQRNDDPAATAAAREDPIGVALSFVYEQIMSIGNSQSYLDVLFHKILIHLAVRGPDLENGQKVFGPQALSYHTVREILRYCDQVVHGINPNLALEITALFYH